MPALAWWPWNTTQDFLKSEFFAALFGAAIGAISAYLFAAWNERRQHRLREIAQANAAIALAHSFINTVVTMKKQHIKTLVDEYRAEVTKALAAQAANAPVINLQMNLMTLNVPYIPGAETQETVISGILHSSHAHIIAVQARQCAESFRAVLQSRNELCEEMKTLQQAQRIAVFLGLSGPMGGDLRYPALMDAIEHYADDCIYFPMLLQEILKDHINSIRYKMLWRAPRALRFDYAKATPWMPDRKSYEDFEQQFRKKETRLEMLQRWPGRWWRGV